MALRTTLLALATSLLLVAPAYAEADAVITGPGTGRAGDLVVLDSGSSKGDNFAWIVPPAAEGRTIECQGKLAFAVATPGTYRFTLIAADREAAIDYATHVVVMSGTQPPPVPDPDDPDDPPPPPPTGLQELSRSRAAALQDPPTAAALAATLAAVQPGSTLLATQGEVALRIEAALRARAGASRDVDWLEGWRRPVSAAIKASTVEEYLLAIKEVSLGLQAAAGAPTAQQKKNVIRVTVPAGRREYEAWLADVGTRLQAAGWRLEEMGTGPLSFDVCGAASCVTVEGYMTTSDFTRALSLAEGN